MARTGRPPSCLCGECAKCKRRVLARERYQSLTLDDRRALIAKRDKEKTRQTDRARYYRHASERKVRMREWAEKHRERSLQIKRAHAERYPEKTKARTAVGNAIRDRKLERKPCEKCGNPKSHAHHFDYGRPLDVVWLCPAHHGEVHRQYPSTSEQREAA